jgi:hypothetical protein
MQVPLLSRKKLSVIIGYAVKTVITSFVNNIKVHFVKRLFGFVLRSNDALRQIVYLIIKILKFIIN